MLLGVVIGLSPWLADQQHDKIVNWNAILVGACVLVLAQLEYVSLKRWEEWCEVALGLWLIGSPFALNYPTGRSRIGITALARPSCCLLCWNCRAGLETGRHSDFPAHGQ